MNHFLCFLVRHGTGPLVTADISLLAELLQLINPIRIGLHGHRKGLNDAIMMGVTAGAVTGSRQSRRGRLKRGIVSDVQFPVGAQAASLAIAQVTVDDTEESGDFFATGCVRLYPAVLFPIGEAHARFPSGISWVPAEQL